MWTMFKYSIIMFHCKACQEKAERKAILNFAFGLLTLLWTWRPPYDKRIFACPIASFTTRSSEFQTENAQIRNSHHFSTHQLRFFQIQGLLCFNSVAFSRTCKLLFFHALIPWVWKEKLIDFVVENWKLGLFFSSEAIFYLICCMCTITSSLRLV